MLSCGIQLAQLAIIQTVFQIPVVQFFLEHHKDYCQKFPRRRTNCLSRTLFSFLSRVEVHQRRVRSIDHRENRPDCHCSQSFSALLCKVNRQLKIPHPAISAIALIVQRGIGFFMRCQKRENKKLPGVLHTPIRNQSSIS